MSSRLLNLGILGLLGAGLPAQASLDMDYYSWPVGHTPSKPENQSRANGPDGLNDLWQALHDAWEIEAEGDEDADGCSNLVESIAGTNPFLPGDCLKVGNMVITSTQVVFTFHAKAGKKYRVLSAASPGDTFTTAETLASPQSGTEFVPATDVPNQTLRVAKSVDSRRFYRLEATDVDTNADGVSDWVARKLGYNPAEPKVDLDGDGVSDLKEQLEAQMTSPDVVSVVASRPFASEDGPESGAFLVRRNRSLFDATVELSYSGTANSSTDYSRSPAVNALTFAPGESEKLVFINPNSTQGALVEGSESVTVTLSNPSSTTTGAAPAVGYPSTATVVIQDGTQPSGSGLTARYYDHSSGTYLSAANFGDAGTYSYTRSGTSPNFTGVVVITPNQGDTAAQLAAINTGALVRLSFSDGNLNTGAINHGLYTVTAKTATTFTCALPSGSSLPASGTGNGFFSLPGSHPARVARVDPTVDFEWGTGTPNGNTITPANSPDNWSSVWEGFLNVTTAGNYRFQLDADDRGRVLLDLNNNGTFDLPTEQIVEHGWDSAASPSPEDGTADDETIGVFKISASHALTVPSGAAQRLRIRVELVESSGEARCRFQWSRDGGTFGNIPQSNVFSHVATMNANYSYTRTVTTAGAMQGTIGVTLNNHGYSVGQSVALAFSSGNLFTPANGNFHGNYTVAAVGGANTFTVNIAAPTLPATGTGAGFVLNRPDIANPVNAWYNVVWQNTTFSGAPGRVGTNNNGTNDSNNGIYGTGTPDSVLINPETFTARWSGQVQPQFTEEYTISVLADDGVTLRINGQEQDLKVLGSANNGGSSYYYDNATGNTIVYYAGSNLKLGSVLAGETLRLDPSNGNLNLGNNSTYTYDGGTGDLVVTYSNLANVNPGGFTVGETVEVDPTSGTVDLGLLPYTITAATATTFTVNIGTGVFASGSGNINVSDNGDRLVTAVHAAGLGNYNYDSATGNTVVDFSMLGLPAGTFQVGNTVLLDPTGGNLSGQPFAYRTITAATATTFTVSYPTGSGNSSSTIAIVATNTTASIPANLTGAFVVSFGAGKHANASVGGMNFNFVNKSLRDWSANGNERYVRLPMIGGKRYDIELEYWEGTGFARCRLFWFSPSQPKQIIPASRLYPVSAPQAPAEYVAPTDAIALTGGSFSLPVAVNNGGVISFQGLPAWLTFANGTLTGTPPADATGDHQIVVTVTNDDGVSTSVINLEVINTGGEMTRDVWTGIAGSGMEQFPQSGQPTSTGTVSSMEGPTNFGDDYATRLRGFLTAPETGNYYFWVAGSGSAELWISNDSEPVNAFRRARVVTGSAVPRSWSVEADQKSPWLALEQGRRYYIEVRHKAGTGAGDNLAVGWARPGQPTTQPSEVVPGFVLSPWEAPVAPVDGGTVWAATLRPQGGAVTNASGSSFLRVNAAETEAIITANYTGLTSAFFGMHVHNDMIPGGGTANIIADLEEPGDVQLLPDGTYKWVIKPTAGYSVPQLIEHLKSGKIYFNVHSVDYPGGEIKGYYTRLEGSPVFVPPPAPPAWSDDSNTDAGAQRFLSQATFGASAADIQALKSITPTGGKGRYELWIEDQFTKPASQTLPEVLRTRRADAQGGSAFDETLMFNSWWRNSVSGEDQLRQRVAFALSQIHVVSGQGPLDNRGEALAYFYDKLNEGAFGSFRDILETTTLTPTMGRYLDMLRNDKPDKAVGRIPNENYAREIKQLFSIGLFRMWPDGTLILNSRFEPIDTYTQREIVGYSHVFTGWDYGYDGPFRTSMGAATNWMRQMREVPARHFTGYKRILNNEVLPGIVALGPQRLDPHATHISAQINQPAYQALPSQELDAAHDQLFENPNTGPFICRQLIQRMVTSHPSKGYLYRVVQKFNDNGAGVRGDMKAVIKAILLDYEARSPAMITEPGYGKQREPLLRLTAVGRAFRTPTFSGAFSQNGTRTITVNTATPHRLANGTNVFLEFTASPTDAANGVPPPATGVYGVTGVTNSTTFTVNSGNWATGAYSIPANSTTCTVTMTNHWLQTGHQVFVDFTSGLADNVVGLDRQVYTLLSASAQTGTDGTFTFTVPTTSTSARTGNCMLPRFTPGSYTVGGSGLPAPNDRRVTIRTNDDHHLKVGDQVQLNITDGNPRPVDLVATVDTVVDLRTWTFLVSSATTGYNANQGNNGVYQFPLVSLPLTRTGTINSRSSTYQMGNTDGTLEQSPLNPDTVFNFFLPDYRYPGILANAGLTTPEFQLTAETTTVRQANFIYGGIFNPNVTNGFSSFSDGNNGLALDYSNLISGNATGMNVGQTPASTSVPWTHNQNIARLIDNLCVLLTADQMPSAARTVIRDLVALPISSISTGNPCTVTTTRPHRYTTGQSVCVSGVGGGTFVQSGTSTSVSLNDTSTARTITVTGPSTFTITGVQCNTAPTASHLSNAHASQIIYNQGNSNPTTSERRERIRSILHLILTSPDYTIQR